MSYRAGQDQPATNYPYQQPRQGWTCQVRHVSGLPKLVDLDGVNDVRRSRVRYDGRCLTNPGRSRVGLRCDGLGLVAVFAEGHKVLGDFDLLGRPQNVDDVAVRLARGLRSRRLEHEVALTTDEQFGIE